MFSEQDKKRATVGEGWTGSILPKRHKLDLYTPKNDFEKKPSKRQEMLEFIFIFILWKMERQTD